MKIVIVAILILQQLFASHISWLGNYDKALVLAKKENKPLMVVVIKSKSTQSKNIIKNLTFNNQIAKKFICVIVNFDIQDYPIELFYTTVFPTIFLINPKNEQFIKEPLYYPISANEISKSLLEENK